MSALKNWQEEKRSAYLYIIMSKRETHPLRKKLFLNLAEAAEDQAKIWEKRIQAIHLPVPSIYQPNLRTRLVGWLVKQIGVERLRYVLSAMKVRGMSVFSQAPINHEHRHTTSTAVGNLRAAIFGVNDGLISNVSLILGFAGASANHEMIIIAGVAGLLAGACSMAAGEFVSVASQREVYEYQIELEKQELEEYPEEEAEELALIYEARGVPKTEAIKLGQLLINNPNTALETLTREELGINPNELGSPVGAMLSSFFSFSVGATVPIVPFLLGDHRWNLTISLSLTVVLLFIIGTMTSLFTNKNAIKSGFRMLLVGAISGGLTYLIGKLLGVALH